MSLWKRTMDYLGLGPDDAYDDYDGYDEPEPPARQMRAQRDTEPADAHGQRGGRGGWEPEGEPTVRTVAPRPSFPSKDFDASAARRQPARQQGPRSTADDSGVQVRPSQPEPPSPQPQLRSIPGGAMEPHTVRPRRFDQAQEVADAFKSGTPVIMNLEGTERDVARRLIDFASGICYALDGTMEKVATGVYLLKPSAARPQRFDGYDD
ncbi:MAG: cell division protein SepF [Ilumatobacter sp.]|jgi:cell division inhibitor SepF|uniref:cell division protein SepF n=1 Tax=Ilumatobacter sp. TaxID=1967498 RepID=UPI003918831A